MRVNEGRVETLFGEGTGPSLALQLNNEDGLSLFRREGGDFIPFHLDQVTDWLVRLKSYSHTFFEQQFPFIDPCKVPGSVNI